MNSFTSLSLHTYERKPFFQFNLIPSFDFSPLEEIENENLKNLLRKLICKPEDRLIDYSALKSDPYFSSIDWERLEKCIGDENELEDYAYEFGLNKFSEDISY